MRDASMAQPHDLIPLCGDKALRDAQTQCLHKAGLQRGEGHVAKEMTTARTIIRMQ